MLRDFLQDRLINKLNGYFLILYANDNIKLAWVVERMNNVVVFILVVSHLIPSRRRVL
ncbi:MAG: hypothetical protein ACMUJM_05035 [bacterium]